MANAPEHSGRARTSRSIARWSAAILLLLVVVAPLTFYGVRQAMGNFYEPEARVFLTHTVKNSDLLITVTEDGNVESASNIDIKCQVAGGSSILWIVEDGKVVEQGEKLVELDKSQLEDQINQQTITTEKARSAMIQAEKDLSVAKISVDEYLQGTFKKELQDADANITIAEENLRSSQNALAHSQRMFRRGYISELELESQQFSVRRAQLELDSANTAKEVLEKFTKVKTLEDLRSQVETARAKMESEKAAFSLEDARLKRLRDQIAQCDINAPQAGMVVYANDASRGRFGGQQGPQIEEGATVRERQTILRLPDLDDMQVKVNVHETKVESLAAGMRARIVIQDQEFTGTVISIANQPEPTSWFSGNVKEYATVVRIEGSTAALKPGMTAEVEILIAHLKDVPTLPVASVVEQRGQYFCWVSQGGKVARRKLKLGLSNDKFIAVEEGIEAGEVVLLNPRGAVEEARTEEPELEEEASVEDRFGKSTGEAPARGKGKRPAPRGGEAKGRPGDGPSRAPEGGGGERPSFDLMQNDADGDGKISKDEAPEFMKSWFDNVDSNGDGALDSDEISAMRRSRQRGEGGSEGGGGRRSGGRGNLMQYDSDQDGRVSKDEAPERMQSFFDRLDGNGDGFIDAQEVQQMRSRMGSGGGPGGGAGGGTGPGGPGGGGRGFP